MEETLELAVLNSAGKLFHKIVPQLRNPDKKVSLQGSTGRGGGGGGRSVSGLRSAPISLSPSI